MSFWEHVVVLLAVTYVLDVLLDDVYVGKALRVVGGEGALDLGGGEAGCLCQTDQ